MSGPVDALAAMDRSAEAAKFERDSHKYGCRDISGWWDRLYIDTKNASAAVAELIDAAQWALKLDDAGAMSDTARHNLEAALANVGGAA